ncbi:hypothetical protein RBWH47_03063 [Rhodopirellula baltica WH47]|uniref:Uncharacterized protein n=1 Tax=Rhodopirellula baltica WH47 TaxID=991778 RepID=F2ASI6_RHOBT|nr:hypothetical protein RBWH47_03063 [Rhodopirellula baltica WH47]
MIEFRERAKQQRIHAHADHTDSVSARHWAGASHQASQVGIADRSRRPVFVPAESHVPASTDQGGGIGGRPTGDLHRHDH